MTLRRTSPDRFYVSLRGFTMMELMVVIAIILVLAGMAAARYEQSVVRAREAVLKQDLKTMRGAIQQYTLDKQQAPQSLNDLVAAGYLTQIPVDPITRTADWHAGLRRFYTESRPKWRRDDRCPRDFDGRLALRSHAL